MNAQHPDYPELLRSVIEKIRAIVKESYQPYFEQADVKDIVNYELHVVCSFLMNFLMNISDNGHKANGEKLTVPEAYGEFCKVMEMSLTEYIEFCENTEMTEH